MINQPILSIIKVEKKLSESWYQYNKLQRDDNTAPTVVEYDENSKVRIEKKYTKISH
jgi:hypothetical protein